MRRLKPVLSLFLALLIGGSAVRLSAQTTLQDPDHRFIDFTAGLGIAVHNAQSLANYINLITQPAYDQRLAQFTSAAEFYAVPEFQVSPKMSVGLEYSLLVKSYSLGSLQADSRWEMSYQIHMPTLLVHYLVFGQGYRVKLGGGVGYHFISFNQNFTTIGSDETLRSEGIGFKVDAVGNTQFDETFYGSIGVDLRWDFLGTLKSTTQTAGFVSSIAAPPRVSFFNAGVKFGITFQLH